MDRQLAKDVRIGNYLGSINEVYEVNLINEDGNVGVVLVNCSKQSVGKQKTQIAITNESLSFFDFIEIERVLMGSKKKRWVCKYFDIIFTEKDTQVIIFTDLGDRLLNHIKHIHQLQNLYYTLSGFNLHAKGIK